MNYEFDFRKTNYSLEGTTSDNLQCKSKSYEYQKERRIVIKNKDFLVENPILDNMLNEYNNLIKNKKGKECISDEEYILRIKLLKKSIFDIYDQDIYVYKLKIKNRIFSNAIKFSDIIAIKTTEELKKII